ncbi:chalcone isomerase, partial [Lipomyces arxii]|uniref:chalcone isomerase n=1 Tax=Lipomyces arxii TaxID=56418 RepID=UPI0034CDA648
DTTWQPDTSVDAFPRSMKIDNENYTILGLGVRTVSFFKIHVYAVGIYIANSDIKGMMETMSSSDDLSRTDVIASLINKPTRFALRIVPVRKTDFNHLRDGFVRSIVGSSEQNEGVDELRSVFSRKLSVPKNGELMMMIQSNGSMKCTYSSSQNNNQVEVLGYVNDRDTVKALFNHYLNKPAASESAQSSFIDSI